MKEATYGALSVEPYYEKYTVVPTVVLTWAEVESALGRPHDGSVAADSVILDAVAAEGYEVPDGARGFAEPEGYYIEVADHKQQQ